MRKRPTLSRRTFLRGAGVAIALPWLEAMQPASAVARAAQTANTPRRLAFLYVPNGVNIAEWTPTGLESKFEWSPSLKVLEPLRDQLTVLSGLHHPNSRGGHSGADTFLTGADLAGTPGYDYRNRMSVDQLAAEMIGYETRLPSLEMSSESGTGSPGHSHTLSFNRDGLPVPAENRPRRIFERLFVDGGGTRKQKARRLMEQRSILDAVLGQSRDLNRRLSTPDQRKLDEYLTSVREVEQRVEQAEKWLDVPRPKIDASKLALDVRPNDWENRSEYAQVMYDLIYLAFRTDTTRVCTYEIGREASGGYFPELDLKSNHHELSHHGGDGDMLSKLGRIDRFHLTHYRRFLQRLADTPEGDGTLLDHTVVMYGSGMNSGKGGGHSPKNLPLLLAGGRGLGFRRGRHLDFQDQGPPLSNLFVTLLQKTGFEVDRFSDATGAMSEVG